MGEIGWGLIALFVFSLLFYFLSAILVTEIFTLDDQYKTYYHIWHFPSMYFAFILFIFVFASTDKVILSLRRHRKSCSCRGKKTQKQRKRRPIRFLEEASEGVSRC